MMEEEQDQISITVDHQEDIVEDASSETDESPDPIPDADLFKIFSGKGMIKIGEETSEYEETKKRFLTGMKKYAKDAEIVALHKIRVSNFAVQARYAAFRAHERAVLNKNGEGVANIWCGWYSGSKDEISQIISYGFSRSNGQSHGVGVHLSTTTFLLDGLASSSADENGIRHMLLCNVLMGKIEVVPAGSKQIYPSSVEFDSGVDNLEAPRRLVVWSAFMNSHIFPTHILSFKVPHKVLLRNQISEISKHGTIRLADLFLVLEKFLGPAKRALVAKILDDFRKRKIPGLEMVKRLCRVVGDNQLLIAIIKTYKDKPVVRASSRTSGALAAAYTGGKMF